MAVDEKRNPQNRIDQGVWSECEITWQRSHVTCAFVAFEAGGDGEEVLRSAPFRWRRGGGGPVEAPDAVASLAALEESLIGEGWELIAEPHDKWYARRFRRSVVPLMQRIAPYRAEGALIAFVESEPPDAPAELEPVTSEPMPADLDRVRRLEVERFEAKRREAERLEAERVEAERVEAERRRAERVEAERLEAERVEAERLEAERLEAERVEAERVEAERVEAERREAERRNAERVEAERLEAERR